jgi:hypothetical protein
MLLRSYNPERRSITHTHTKCSLHDIKGERGRVVEMRSSLSSRVRTQKSHTAEPPVLSFSGVPIPTPNSLALYTIANARIQV